MRWIKLLKLLAIWECIVRNMAVCLLDPVSANTTNTTKHNMFGLSTHLLLFFWSTMQEKPQTVVWLGEIWLKWTARTTLVLSVTGWREIDVLKLVTRRGDESAYSGPKKPTRCANSHQTSPYKQLHEWLTRWSHHRQVLIHRPSESTPPDDKISRSGEICMYTENRSIWLLP